MKALKFFALFFLVFGHNHLYAQNLKVYYAMKYLNDSETGFLRDNSYSQAQIIYQVNIDPKDEGAVNTTLLQTAILAQFPTNSAIPLGILDWEGKTAKRLESLDPSAPEFKAIIDEFIKAVRLAKKLRPNVKWGFYGIPLKGYSSRGSKWKDKSLAFLPLLSECDFIAPSLYKYKSKNDGSGVNESDYVRDNVLMSLKMGSQINKPVIPFVWQRVHPSNKTNGYELINDDDFKSYLKTITTTTLNNKRVTGIIWWSNDKTLMSNKILMAKKNTLKNRVSSSFSRNTTATTAGTDTSSLSVIKKYSDLIKSVINTK